MKKTILLLALSTVSFSIFSSETILEKNDFTKNAQSWNVPKVWPGKLVHKDGKLTLSSTTLNKKTYGQCTKMILSGRHLSGSILELSLDAKGSGTISISCMLYPQKPKTPYTVKLNEFTLTNTTKTYKKKLDLSKLQTDRIALILTVPGNNSITFDNVVLKKSIDKTVKINVPSIPVTPGSAKDIILQSNLKNTEVSVFSNHQYYPIKSSSDGTIVIPKEKIIFDKYNSSDLTVAYKGSAIRFQTSIVPLNKYNKAVSLAKKINNDNLSILWIGDSELDFDRSRNTTSQINFYLNKVRKNSASFYNFAVAGDLLIRVNSRLANLPCYRKEAYNTLPSAKPNLIIIMLGHNDTLTFSKNNFTDSQTPLKDQVKLTKKMVTFLKGQFPAARVLLISPLSLDGTFLRNKAVKNAKNKNYYYFGNPVMMKKFTDNFRQAAKECNVEFLDIYTPMSKIKDRLKFFKENDEVHLNSFGHIYLTEQILTYLAKNNKLKNPVKNNAPASFSFKAEDFKGNTISKNGATLYLEGEKKLSTDGKLLFDGKSNSLQLIGIQPADVKNGFTLDLAYQIVPQKNTDKASSAYDCYFHSDKSFILARYNRSLYMLYFDGKKYQKGFLTGPIFDLSKKEATHIAVTCKYHEAVDQGEIWTEIQIYLNGRSILNRKLQNIKLKPPLGNWEFGSSSYFGKAWSLGGKIAGGSYTNRVLNEKEIRDKVLEYSTFVKPAFKLSAALSKKTIEKINSLKLSDAKKSACLALAKNKSSLLDKVLAAPNKYLLTIGTKNVLTILDAPGNLQIPSFYDAVNKRELLSWNNPFFDLHLQRGTTSVTLSMVQLENFFLQRPATNNGITSFVLGHRKKTFPKIEGKSFWKFDGEKLEYSLEVKSLSNNTLLKEVSIPSVIIAPLDSNNTNLVVPQAGGLLYKNAAKEKITYQSIYPRMMTSMQCGSVYDTKGGVYFSPADPLGKVKTFNYRCDLDGTTIKINWPCAFYNLQTPNSFSTETPVVIHSFKGDWYDTGILYRKELARTKALWWIEKLPNTNTPLWFRNNCLNLLVFHIPSFDKMVTLRNYLEAGYTIQHWYWWERGPGHHFSPIARPNAQYTSYAKLARQHDIRVLSYTNGRLWSPRDKRGQSTLYKTEGVAAAVKLANNSIKLEPYGIPCAVLCPASKSYQKAMFNMITRLASQGISGCFVDQLGAARPILCQIPTHGHLANDNKSWNVNGHYKAFTPIKKYWKNNNIDAIMTTEDNSEHCVNLVDGLMPWRWMHDNQIPLHALVYSGRTQYTSRDPVGADLASAYPKTATQIVQGEQMGHFGVIEMTTPAKGNFRRYIKRLIHLRLACISYFNSGLMERPPVLLNVGKKITTTWGNHGTKKVSTLPVIAGKWNLNGSKIIILINTTSKVVSGKIANVKEKNIYTFNSNNKKVAEENSFLLDPYGCELRFYGKTPSKETLLECQKRFAIIKKTFSEKDPFGTDKMVLPKSKVFNANKWQIAAKSPIVLGARANMQKNVLDNVYYCLFYAGIGNFGKSSKGYFEVELSAPSYSGGGNIEIMLDHPDNGTLAGTLTLDRKNILTKTWDDYQKYRIPALIPISNTHKVFFKLNGGSVCNFRNWRYVSGDVK